MDREEVAHELRTPLTTIKGVLKLITAGRLAQVAPEDASELVHRAWHQLVKLETVVERIESQFRSGVGEEEALVLYEENAASEP